MTALVILAITSCKNEKNENKDVAVVEKKAEEKSIVSNTTILENYKGLSADAIVDNYFKAIGGIDKVQSIKTLVLNAEVSLQGQKLKIVTKEAAPNKSLTVFEVMGQKQREFFNGEKAFMEMSGQKMEMTGEDAVKYKNYTAPFTDVAFRKGTVTGEEEVEGKKAYVITLGDKQAFYDIKTALKLKEVIVSVNPDNGKKEPMSTYFKDYKTVDGVKFPFTVIQDLGLGDKMELKVTSYEINKNVTDKDFQ